MNKLRRTAIVAVLLVAACGYAPTTMLVYQQDDGKLRHCDVTLGLTVVELEAQCGVPLMKVPSAGRSQGEDCWIYYNEEVAPMVAACIGEASLVGRGKAPPGGESHRAEKRRGENARKEMTTP
ncbi:MAG: hypothetical protein AMXMBFR64_04890 [Myxococcales bacterium]